jgi:hypothetical protein
MDLRLMIVQEIACFLIAGRPINVALIVASPIRQQREL